MPKRRRRSKEHIIYKQELFLVHLLEVQLDAPLHHMISLMPILLVMTSYLTDVKLLHTELLELLLVHTESNVF